MDEAKRLDISQLQHAVTLSGTDFGIQTMSVTVPLSVPTISRHLRLYNRYACLETCAYVEAENSLSDSELLLPKPVKIRAKNIEEISFARRHRRRREKLKKMTPSIKSTEEMLSRNPISHAWTQEQALHSFKLQEDASDTLRNFYHNRKSKKIAYTQSLRTKRACVKRTGANDRSKCSNELSDVHWKRWNRCGLSHQRPCTKRGEEDADRTLKKYDSRYNK
ncbi:uncharacterized protein BYT42DRAFT_197154 [Radiomyces spectabilis]|uniref:uncharacterized protein n=1 Tax=Radiomyces spectabilis TaxID=64574 RepID=UPI0022208FAF|nr:uncharacterized protein BYT42DRAFT_197154 [Radiomyces spectabilis]KAI8391489.1 hypothetical protein BYT42DRAFT_197154 [Radiomyces spectabilis]